MKRTEEQGPTWVKYEYSQDEFKDLLGITDPEDVLLAAVDLYGKRVIVTMSH